MRIRDWSYDGCAFDLGRHVEDQHLRFRNRTHAPPRRGQHVEGGDPLLAALVERRQQQDHETAVAGLQAVEQAEAGHGVDALHARYVRSEEHTSELQSLMRISYAVFRLKKKKTETHQQYNVITHHTQPSFYNHLEYTHNAHTTVYYQVTITNI